MALKTPVLTQTFAPSRGDFNPTPHGPMRQHPRPDLLSQMHRRAKSNARKAVRDVMRSIEQQKREQAERPDTSWSVARLREFAAKHGVSFTTKTRKADLLARVQKVSQ